MNKEHNSSNVTLRDLYLNLHCIHFLALCTQFIRVAPKVQKPMSKRDNRDDSIQFVFSFIWNNGFLHPKCDICREMLKKAGGGGGVV